MNELQKEIQQQLEKYRLDRIEPTAEQDDQEEKFRMEIFKELGELGFTGVTTAEQYDGMSLGYQDLCVVLAELAKSSVSYAVTISVSSMVQGILSQFGNDKQKENYLPPLAKGQKIGAFCLTESSAGSDAASLKTTAKKVDGGYLINGSKMFITSGSIAETFIVMARTGEQGSKGVSAFIVENSFDGFSVGKKEKKMGWKVSPTTEIIFENCFVPEDNLLSQEGMGFKIAMSALDRGRITIGAIAVGLAARVLDESVRYSLEREQFKREIFNFQGLQFMMADMATDIESSRLLVQQSAKLFDEGNNNQKLASMAKLKATDTAMKVTTDGVQIFGGVGYTAEYPMERFMRDAKVLQIVEGSNQIQRVVIARNLKQEYSR
jgi:alkylation response protein AidB-like acyl-CoA dehydrogenase